MARPYVTESKSIESIARKHDMTFQREWASLGEQAALLFSFLCCPRGSKSLEIIAQAPNQYSFNETHKCSTELDRGRWVCVPVCACRHTCIYMHCVYLLFTLWYLSIYISFHVSCEITHPDMHFEWTLAPAEYFTIRTLHSQPLSRQKPGI